MSVASLKSTRSPIGLEIAGRWFRAVQLTMRGDRLKVDAAAMLPRRATDATLDAHETARLIETLERQGFVGSDIVVGIPRDLQLVTELLVPAGKDDEIETMARRDFASVYGEDVGGLEIAWWQLPAQTRALREQRMRVAACPHNEAELILDCFEYAGCSPLALDSTAFAISRAFEHVPGVPTSTMAVIDLDWTSSHLIVSRSGFVVFERTIPGTGTRVLRQRMMDEFDLDEFALDCVLTDIGILPAAEPGALELPAPLREVATPYINDLAAEVRNSLDYLADTYPDAENLALHVVGEGSAIPGLGATLAARLDLTITPTPLAVLASCRKGLESLVSTPELITAFGLALYDG